MTPQRPFQPNPFRLCVGLLSGCLLTACPLTDKYYVEQGTAGASSVSDGGKGGISSTVESGGSAVTSGGTVESGGSVGSNGGTVESGGSAVTSGGPVESGGTVVTSGGTVESGGTVGSSGGTVESGGSTGTAGAAGAPVAGCSTATCGGTCCNSVCVDLQTDAANCSVCGNVCPTGRSCRAGACYGWTPMKPAPAALGARERAAYAVMGSKLFIFGGLDALGNALNSGAIYDKTTDSWTMLPQTINVPSPRQLATAVWSGVRVTIMGGRNATSALSDGARYDPPTNAWLTAATLTAPVVAPWGAHAGTYVLLWGGLTASDTPVSGGARSDYTIGVIAPGTLWYPIGATLYTPQAVTEAAWAYSASSAFIFGGRINGTTKTNGGFVFNFTMGAWSATPLGPTGLSARWGAFAVSDGTSYYLWGGRDEIASMGDGYQYLSSWTNISAIGAPSARWAPHRRTGWAFAFGAGDIAIVGGMDFAGNPLTDGGRYVRATDSWTPVLAWPSQQAHEYGVAALIDGEIFVWGGRNGSALSATGERYLP